MRNLTLGAIIVAGGTLAALPFRNVGQVPDASAHPAQATGPTLSELQLKAGAPALAHSIAPPSGFDPVLAEALPTWQPPRDSFRDRSQFRAPLSFDDLMSPITPPEPIRRRFDATVPVASADTIRNNTIRNNAIRNNAIATTNPPAMAAIEPARMTPPRFEESVAAKPPVAGSLASTPTSDRLPKPTITPDDRHWIRQP